MFKVLMTFVAAALVIYLSYIFSKYVGKNMNKSTNSRYMRLIDQVTVGQDRYMAIMQVGDKYLLVGITAGQINVLTELEADNLLPLSPESDNETGVRTPDFKELMEKFGNFRKKGR